MSSPFAPSAPSAFGGVLFAHRGAPQLLPENTLPSFAAALQAGADVLEMDLRTTRDGALVALHDERLERTTSGTGRVGERTLAYVRAQTMRRPTPHQDAAPALQRFEKGALSHATANDWTMGVPLFDEVLHAFPDAALNVDLKDCAPAEVPRALAILRDARARGAARGRILLSSADARVQAALDAHLTPDDRVARGIGQRDVVQVLAAARLGLGPIERLRGRACQMPLTRGLGPWRLPLVTRRLVRYLHRMDCALHLWDEPAGSVDDAQLARKLFALGVDGIFTDAIHRLAPALRGATGDDGVTADDRAHGA